VGAARAWQNLGQITTETGQHAEAAKQLREAERRFEVVGDRWGMASAINSQGDVARYQGQLTQAAELYRRARGLFRAIGSASWTFPNYNLALVHLARREFGEARPIMEESLPAFTKQGNRPAQTDVLIGLAACAASECSWLLFDDHMDEVAGALRATASADEDTARLLSTAGDVAVAQGEGARGIQAYRLARGQWRILGREAEMRHLDEFVAQLEQRDG
jgi:tetratricopeptide (TPR) repeat protein